MDLRLIAVPYDSGLRDWRMGAGPGRLLESGLADELRAAGHTVSIDAINLPPDEPTAEIRTAFELAGRVANRVRAARDAGALPIVLAGNCGTAVGTLSGMDGTPGVLWLDAHGDVNTPETTGSGFLDGMALSIATGRCWGTMVAGVPGFRPIPDTHVLHVGARDLDEGEVDVLRASGITHLPPDRVSDAPAALDDLRSRTDTVYLHIDLDVLDPAEAPANHYAVPGGLTVGAVCALLREVRSRFTISAIAFTAYDPACDPAAAIPRAALHILTASLAPAA